MKKIFIIALLVLSLWSVSGMTVMAASTGSLWPLVQCGTGTGKDANGNYAAQQCDFSALISLVSRIMQYLIYIAMPLAAISFAYAGWLYLSAGGNSSQVSKAHTIFMDVGIGFILILSAWLIFDLIAKNFLDTSKGFNSYLTQ